jgi:hypothetical protein
MAIRIATKASLSDKLDTLTVDLAASKRAESNSGFLNLPAE